MKWAPFFEPMASLQTSPTTEPRVSVIIPVRNYARYVGAAIESALEQRYPLLEVIVVDDGSTDETPMVLEQFKGRVRAVRLDGRGVAEARNMGLALATGDFVVFLDADDLLLDGIAAQAAYLVKHRDVSAVHGPWYSCDVRTGICSMVASRIHSRDILTQLLLGNVVTTPSSLMIRRQALVEVGGFDPAASFAADWELWLRLAVRGYRFGAISQAVAVYRIHRSSMSRNLAQAARDIWYVLDKYFGDAALPPRAKDVKGQAYFNMGLYLGKLYLEQGDEQGAAIPLELAIRALPEAPYLVDFYYEIAKAIWRRFRLEGQRNSTTAAEAAVRFAMGIPTFDSRPSVDRHAVIHLGVSLMLRRAGAQQAALKHMRAALSTSHRAVLTWRHLPVLARIILPRGLTLALKSTLELLRLRPSSRASPPDVVTAVMASQE
jgi:glycosyltransferase involved in cell wall biosynthesis